MSSNCNKNRKKIYDILKVKYGSDCNVSKNLLKDLNKLYRQYVLSILPDIEFNLKTINPFLIAHAERYNDTYIVSISRKLISLTDPQKKKYNVGGIKCRDRLSCIQVLFEHELIHIINDMQDNGNNDIAKDPHGKDFIKLMKNLVCHKIITNNLLDGIVIPLKPHEKIKIFSGDCVDLRLSSFIERNNHSDSLRSCYPCGSVSDNFNDPAWNKIGIIEEVQGEKIIVKLNNGEIINITSKDIQGLIPKEILI